MMRLSKFLAVAFVLAVAWAMATPAFAATISSTPHDFVTNYATWQGTGTGTAPSLCSACHTPHKTSSATLMWNHTLSSASLTFGTGTATSSGTNLPTNVGSWTGTSKNCLSCHDGTIAVGSTITGTAWGDVLITNTAKIVGPNLAGNHPIAIPYPDQSGATYNSITTAANPTDYVASPTGVKIYGTAAGSKGIECASCHDPHVNTSTPFLRVAVGTLCTSCHVK